MVLIRLFRFVEIVPLTQTYVMNEIFIIELSLWTFTTSQNKDPVLLRSISSPPSRFIEVSFSLNTFDTLIFILVLHRVPESEELWVIKGCSKV